MRHPIIVLLPLLAFTACGDDTSAPADVVADTTDVAVPTDTGADTAQDTTAPDTSAPIDTEGSADATPDVSQDVSMDDAAQETSGSDVDADEGPTGEDLCWETGGAWMMGSCDCQQDGATTSLGYFFDPELGCIPDPALLCAATGGVWEDGDCECAQDGASIHWEFHPKRGCAFPSDEDLSADILSLELLELVERYASPDQRVWLIDNPGAFMVIYPMDSPDDVLAHMAPGWTTISEAAGACSGELERDLLPVVDCDEDSGMEPTGCFLKTVSEEYDRVSVLMQIAVDYEIADWTADEIERAREDERTILKVHVASSHRVTLAFRRLSGAWVLVAVDLARYSCSA